jgi:hypothetical protein
MPLQDPEEFVTFIKNHAGESLRTVVAYNDAEFSPLYVRADLSERYDEAAVERIASVAREATRESGDLATDTPVGDLQCRILSFERAVVMNFTVPPASGIVVSVDEGAAQRLQSFVGACRSHIAAEAAD